jgi:hypothetical protein
MTETYRSRAFGDSEALDWLHSQPDGRVTASAAELGRQWGWNRMRPGRRLRTWQEAGSIRRNTDEIIVTTSVTPNVTAAVGVSMALEAAGAITSLEEDYRLKRLTMSAASIGRPFELTFARAPLAAGIPSPLELAFAASHILMVG